MGLKSIQFYLLVVIALVLFPANTGSGQWGLTKISQAKKINETKPRLKTLPIEERYRDYYNTIEIGYAWIVGFRPWNYWTNTTNCFNRITNNTYIEYPLYKEEYDAAHAAGDSFVKANLTTTFIQNLSMTGWYCNSALNSSSHYWDDRYEEYELEFKNPFGMFMLSALQNLLGSIISINSIYQSIDNNMAIMNNTGVHYDLARLTRVLLIFDPIEPEEDDYNYIPPETDPDLNTGLYKQALRQKQGKQKNELVDEGQTNSDWSSFSETLIAVTKYLIDQFPKPEYKVHNPPDQRQEQQNKMNGDRQHHRLREGSFDEVNDFFVDGADGSLSDFWNLDDGLQLTRGFLNATQIIYGQNRTGCQQGLENIWYAGDEAKLLIQRYGFKYFNILEAIDQVFMVTYSLHNVTYDCFYGLEELGGIKDDYWTVIKSPSTVVWNLVFGAGSIYTGLRNLLLYFYELEYTRVKNAFDFGMECGQIFWYMFFPQEQYIKYLYLQGKDYQQDYTWDTEIK